MTSPKLREGDIDAFLRLNRYYFRLLDDPATVDKTRRVVLQEIADNFRLLDHWLSRGKPLPKAWGRRERRGVHISATQSGSAPRGASEQKEGRG